MKKLILKIKNYMMKSDERGQAMVEFALVFPIQLFLTLGILQMALLMIGKEVVSYASYCAARAEIVGEDPAQAAQLACIPIAGPSGGGETITIPGWRTSIRSRGATSKTTVQVIEAKSSRSGKVVVRVVHLFELQIPFVNYFFTSGPTIGGYPHIAIAESCVMADPQR